MIRVAVRRIAPPLALLVALLVTWELGLYHYLLDLKIFTVPYPTAVVEAFFEGWYFFRKNAYDTFYAAGVGYVLGSLAGISLAILLSEVDALRRYLLPVASGFAAMPILATAPLMVLYFGLGSNSAIAVVVLMSIPPTVISVYKGLISIEPESRELLESLAVGRWGGLTKLKIPNALPWIFTSLKLNVTLAPRRGDRDRIRHRPARARNHAHQESGDLRHAGCLCGHAHGGPAGRGLVPGRPGDRALHHPLARLGPIGRGLRPP